MREARLGNPRGRMRSAFAVLLLSSAPLSIAPDVRGQDPKPATCDPQPTPSASAVGAGRQGSVLLARYRDAKVEELERLASREPTSGVGAARQAERRSDLAFELATASMRVLLARGLARDASADARRAALATVGLLAGEAELRAAAKVLGGEADRPDHLASDPELRRAYFAALARDAAHGQPLLVDLAIRSDDPVRQHALDAMPEVLAPPGQQALARQLAGDRELFVNRAAMIAGAHGTAVLIPSLVAAQYDPPRATQGDEAWIAIGKTVSYVQGVVPVVGDASGAFQPIIGRVFEGSVLRIMESVVEIYRTEASAALASIVERETGSPAPPFGYDEERWLAWYENEFPRLAARHADERAAQAHRSRTRTESARDDL